MLGVRTYTRDYVDECRSKVARDSATYNALLEAARKAGAPAHAAAEGAEPLFFGSMVVILDSMFVHRLRTVEGKDGNPLNEVRVIAEGILNGNTVQPEKAIRWAPEKTVLGYRPGDAIGMTAATFERLSTAFFAAVEEKFV